MTDLNKETKTIAKHSSVYMIGAILNRVIGFLMIPVYTRFLVPADYGIMQLVALTADVIGMVISVGIGQAMYRFYFEYPTEDERNELISTAIISFGIMALISLSIASLFSGQLSSIVLNSPKYWHFFLISFSSLWFNTIVEMGYNYLRIQQRSTKFLVYSSARLMLSLSLNIYTVAFAGMGVLGVLISTLITSIVMNIILILPTLVHTGFKFSKGKCKQMLKYGAPIIPTNIAAFIVHASDRFFVKQFVGLADAGIYSLGYRFGNLPNEFIAAPFMQIWEVRFLKAFNDTNASKLFGQLFTYLYFLLVLFGLGISSLIRETFMIMADPSYWGAWKITPIIVISYIIFSFQYFFNMGIYFKKKTHYLAIINVSNAFLNIILNLLLIRPYGMWGAAYATLICFIYKALVTYFISNRMYKIDIEVLRMLKITLAASAIYMIGCTITAQSLFLMIVIKFCLVLTLPLPLYWLNFYTLEERVLMKAFWRSPKRVLFQIIKTG